MPSGNSGGGQWTSGDGGDAQLLPAFLPAGAAAVEKTIELFLALFTALSLGNSDDGAAVLQFNAKEYTQGEQLDADAFEVGRRTRAEVDQACPRHGEVQSLTDQAAATVRSEGNYVGAADYGTKVHTELRDQIRAIGDPSFRAEVSAIKSRDDVGYGASGSVRVDVLENVGNGTVCVYDIKTGATRLGAARMVEIASIVHSIYPGTKQVLVIEMRPRR